MPLEAHAVNAATAWRPSLAKMFRLVSVLVFNWLVVFETVLFYCFEIPWSEQNVSWELIYSFRGLVHDHHGGEHSGKQASRHGAGSSWGLTCDPKVSVGEKVWLDMMWVFETSKSNPPPVPIIPQPPTNPHPHPHGTLPPTRSHLLIPPKMFH